MAQEEESPFKLFWFVMLEFVLGVGLFFGVALPTIGIQKYFLKPLEAEGFDPTMLAALSGVKWFLFSAEIVLIIFFTYGTLCRAYRLFVKNPPK